MKSLLAAALLLAASRAFAGPMGAADAHAAPATGFPGAYLGSVSLSCGADPFYGSRFLDAFQTHLQAVTGMTAPSAVVGYLEQAATAGQGLPSLRAVLGSKPLDPPKASAILIANALSRPDQFREILDGLETLKPGMGRHAASILRDAKGGGDRRVIAALRAAGERRPQGKILTYGPDGRFDKLFDGADAAGEGLSGPDSYTSAPAEYTGYGPDGRVRPSGLLPAKR